MVQLPIYSSERTDRSRALCPDQLASRSDDIFPHKRNELENRKLHPKINLDLEPSRSGERMPCV